MLQRTAAAPFTETCFVCGLKVWRVATPERSLSVRSGKEGWHWPWITNTNDSAFTVGVIAFGMLPVVLLIAAMALR